MTASNNIILIAQLVKVNMQDDKLSSGHIGLYRNYLYMYMYIEYIFIIIIMFYLAW